MSQKPMEESSQLRVDDALIAEYLAENPDFFEQYPELLQQMRMQHQARGAVSLVERQQQVLRERVRQLEEEITELMVTARHNESLFRVYSELYVDLLSCTSIPEVLARLQQTFTEELQMPAVQLKFFNSPTTLAEQFSFSADTHKQLLSKRFAQSPIYLGRLTEDEQRLLFPQEHMASVALVLLGEQGELGLLAIGNAQAGHFDPAMDTLLIGQLQALLTHLLPPLLEA